MTHENSGIVKKKCLKMKLNPKPLMLKALANYAIISFFNHDKMIK